MKSLNFTNVEPRYFYLPIVVLALLHTSPPPHAQGATRYWYFGTRAMMEFTPQGVRVGSWPDSSEFDPSKTADTVIISSMELLDHTRALVREEAFTMLEYDLQCSAWLEDMSKLGITLEA